MSSVSRKQKIRMLVILFTLTYMVSYITRINYGAIVAELESIPGMTRNQLSLALTGSFITYGGDRLSAGSGGTVPLPEDWCLRGL